MVDSSSSRIESVDVLRGIVMFLMVFVNDIAGVSGAPWWLKHYYPHDASGMTVADVVFPAFIFIMGMSVPLAFDSRKDRGEPLGLTLLHALLRGVLLIVAGFFMVNMGGYVTRLGITPEWWRIFVYLALILLTLAPAGPSRGWLVARGVGLAGLIFLAAIYRTDSGKWMSPSWWGILGIIGFAYLTCCVAWVLSFGLRPILMIFAAGAMWLYSLQSHNYFNSWRISEYVNIGSLFGSHAAIAIIGSIVGSMLRPSSFLQTPILRLEKAAELLILTSVTAVLTQAEWGINKNAATPAWCLWSCAITIAAWAIVYLLVDVLGYRKWSVFFAAAGTVALMIYFLQPMFYQFIAATNWTRYGQWAQGSEWNPVARAAGCAAAMCAAAIGLAKLNVRLRL